MSLSNFHDVLFPLALARGASGGPERRTEIVALASGGEARNAVWAGSRRRWDVGSAMMRLENLQALTAFFEARGGQLNGFRFRDVSDDRTGAVGADVSPIDQGLGIADGVQTQFDLYKDYDGYARRIWLPVGGSARVAVNGVEVLGGYVVTDGAVVFDTAPPMGALVSAGFEFDCAVRFGSDRLDVSLDAFGAGRAVSVPLVEITI